MNTKRATGNDRSSTSEFSARDSDDRRDVTINVSEGLTVISSLLSPMIMILWAHAGSKVSPRFRESALRPSVFPSAETHFLNVSVGVGGGRGGGWSWRERITQFRHVTIPRLEKPTNFKTNGTVISTPDMTNSRPFLPCIPPAPLYRRIPSHRPARHPRALPHSLSLFLPLFFPSLVITTISSVRVKVKNRTSRALLRFIPTSCDYATRRPHEFRVRERRLNNDITRHAFRLYTRYLGHPDSLSPFCLQRVARDAIALSSR